MDLPAPTTCRSNTPHISRSPCNFCQTEGRSEVSAPSKAKRVRKIQLDPDGSRDKVQTSTSTPARIHGRKNKGTSQGRQTRRITKGKVPSEPECERKLHCLPFVPKKIQEKPKCVIIRVYLIDDSKDIMEILRVCAEQEKLGYIPAHSEMRVLIKSEKRKLKLKCKVNSAKQEEKSLSYDQICGSPHNCVSFEVKYESKSDTVSLKVGQFVKLEVEFLFRIDVGDLQNTSNASFPYEGQGTSTASSSSTRDTVQQGQAVTDHQITKLARCLDPTSYSGLCGKLGFKYNFRNQIKAKHLGDCAAAYEEVLHKWMDETGGYMKGLDEALDSCRLGGLKSAYKK